MQRVFGVLMVLCAACAAVAQTLSPDERARATAQQMTERRPASWC
jgi:hypothetical protein